MAVAAVSSLLLNIGETLASETTKAAISRISAMKELVEDITDIKGELQSMLDFLGTIERLKEKDESTKTIIKQTRVLASNIEDIIDEFTYKLVEEQGGVLPKTLKRCRNITTWRRLSKRLNKIKINLRSIYERRVRYDTNIMGNEASLITAGGSKSPAESAHFVKEDDIVGIAKYRDLLLGWLKDGDEQQQQHVIISVLGMGGLGKTTLVTHVYKIIKATSTFDAWAWVAVSKSCKTEDLLRQILKEFFRDVRGDVCEKREALNNINTIDYRSLVETIHTYLQDKKYVLILDDVWRTGVMHNVKDALQNCETRNSPIYEI